MYRTVISTAPTITLLDRSPLSSRNTQTLFNAFFGMRPIGATLNMEEGNNSRTSDISNGANKYGYHRLVVHPP